MENLNNNSPAETPESTVNKNPDTAPEEKKELPVFKLHASLEVLEYVKAEDLPSAMAKLKELKLGQRLKPGQITFLEEIPHEQYKNFKVEIID